MKANELRIGNWVLARLVPYQIDEMEVKASGYGRIGLYHNYRIDKGEVRPIPLTEEWLLKLGFDKSDLIGFDGGWQYRGRGKYYIQQMSNAITIHLITEESIALLTGFHFVHQLQNLYFALTGEELSVPK